MFGIKQPHSLLMIAFNKMDANNFTKLFIIGKGSLRKKMEYKIKEYHLEKNVKFFGVTPQAEVAEVMRISDVFLLTSASEGMPISILESLGCGLPVVSTNAGEVKKVIREGFSGKIVSNRNQEVMGEAVLDVLNNRRDFSIKNCLLCIQDYTAKKVLEKVYKIHYQILDKDR